jgi:endonuclease/exonuclease/phosphatase family metal-dependent hydrolase
MAAINADVWVLTETYKGFEPGEGYTCVSISTDASDRDAANDECWVAVWSKTHGKMLTLDRDTERTAGATFLLDDGKVVAVVGTVLPWLADKKDQVVHGAAGFIKSLELQAQDWERLQTTFCGRWCVAGDFNQDLLPTGHYYGSRIGREVLRSVLAKLRLDCITGGVDDPLSSVKGLATVDHICIGHGLKTIGASRSNVWPKPGELTSDLSDHYGVWAEFVCR